MPGPGLPPPGPWWRQLLVVLVTAGVVVLAAPGPFRWSLPVALASCALLPLRTRHPRLMVIACLPALVGGLGWPAMMVALYTLGRHIGRRLPTLPWTVLCCVAAVVPVVLVENLQWANLVLTVFASALYSGAPAVLGMLIATREQLETSLRELSAAREATVAAREEVARAGERDRIGREIHDSVGHHATLIAVSAAALAATSPDEHTREAAERLRQLAKRALAEMRAALGLLGADAEARAGIGALPELVERARETGMRVELVGADGLGDDVPLGVERTVYRLVQESLTNAARHAEGAEVEIRLERWARELRVTVLNEPPPHLGVLPPSSRSGGGLAGLAERLGMMGGRLRARPTAKGGFLVQGRLPTPPLDRSPDAVLPVSRPPGLPAVEADPGEADPGEAGQGPGEHTDEAGEDAAAGTKVAAGGATKDGGAVRGAAAH